MAEEDKEKLENLAAILRAERGRNREFLHEYVNQRELQGNHKGDLTRSDVEERIRTAERIDKYELVIQVYDVILYGLHEAFPTLKRQE
ncbi:hypothetical protein HY450_00490 [Candidatus Pacearchaeota archaeon]|nr:hypothetical protein [Candidatus Pacearchaeota archaeon]